MMQADELLQTKAKIGDAWYVAKPEPGPLPWRIRDAWAVVTGKAEAVRFKEPAQ